MSQGKTFLSKLLGISLFQIGAHVLQISDSLSGSHSRLEMSECLKNSVGAPARVQNIFPVPLLLVDDGHKEIGRDKQDGPPELRRPYTATPQRLRVHPHNTPQHPSIVPAP